MGFKGPVASLRSLRSEYIHRHQHGDGGVRGWERNIQSLNQCITVTTGWRSVITAPETGAGNTKRSRGPLNTWCCSGAQRSRARRASTHFDTVVLWSATHCHLPFNLHPGVCPAFELVERLAAYPCPCTIRWQWRSCSGRLECYVAFICYCW